MPKAKSLVTQRQQEVVDYKRSHPNISLEALASWTKDRFNLQYAPKPSFLGSILDNKHDIAKSLRLKLKPSTLNPLLDRVLVYWILERRSHASQPTGRQIVAKAHYFAATLGLGEGGTGFAFDWWPHFRDIHEITPNSAPSNLVISSRHQDALASREWKDEQLLDLAMEEWDPDLEETLQICSEPKSSSFAEAQASEPPSKCSGESQEMTCGQDVLNKTQVLQIRRLKELYPEMTHDDLSQWACKKCRLESSLTEATIDRILHEKPTVSDATSGAPVPLTPIQRREIYNYWLQHPTLPYSSLAIWAKRELHLQREPSRADLDEICNKSAYTEMQDIEKQKDANNSIMRFTFRQRIIIFRKKERNPTMTDIALRDWAMRQFNLATQPSLSDISCVLSLHNWAKEITPVTTRKVRLTESQRRRIYEYRTQHPDLTYRRIAAWAKEEFDLFQEPDVGRFLKTVWTQKVNRKFRDSIAEDPALVSKRRRRVFRIPKLGAISCFMMESPRQAASGVAAKAYEDGSKSRRDAEQICKAYDGDNSDNVETAGSCDSNDEKDDDDYVEPDDSGVQPDEDERKWSSNRTKGPSRMYRTMRSISQEDSEISDDCDSTKESLSRENGVTHGASFGKELHMEGDLCDDKVYMEMDVEDAANILSAMGAVEETENSAAQPQATTDPTRSWTPEEQSASILIVLAILDPDNSVQRSAYLILQDLGHRRIGKAQQVNEQKLRYASDCWTLEEQLQALFTVATLLDMHNPFHVAAHVVLTNKYYTLLSQIQ
ncbi:hypothetical protein BGX28_003840 [Mortierella sp. GBA30]|nr:hypothetical protein BGX28_003840 [Mortierella sp. GBA30]